MALLKRQMNLIISTYIFQEQAHYKKTIKNIYPYSSKNNFFFQIRHLLFLSIKKRNGRKKDKIKINIKNKKIVLINRQKIIDLKISKK